MQFSEAGHDRNVVGAAAVLLGDRVRAAVEEATGLQAATAAALTSLLAWADGHHVDALAGGLRLSQSRTVRVVDALERHGLVERGADVTDRRKSLVHLTNAGRRLARRAIAARARALDDVLDHLSAADVDHLARVAEALLPPQATDRPAARAICRLCDVGACGHLDGRCPVTTGVDRAETEHHHQ